MEILSPISSYSHHLFVFFFFLVKSLLKNFFLFSIPFFSSLRVKTKGFPVFTLKYICNTKSD